MIRKCYMRLEALYWWNVIFMASHHFWTPDTMQIFAFLDNIENKDWCIKKKKVNWYELLKSYISLTVKNVKECWCSSLSASIYIEGNNYIFSTLELIQIILQSCTFILLFILCESPCNTVGLPQNIFIELQNSIWFREKMPKIQLSM